MKVDRFDIDGGIEGVHIEENRAACIMGHVEPTCKNVNILGCLLQGDDMPPACNLLFEGIFFSASGSWIRVVDAEPLLHKRTIGYVFAEAACLRRCSRSPF